MVVAASTGVVVRMVRDKGFGFIKQDNSDIERFFHRSDAPDFDQLVEKRTRVSFVEADGAKGPRASNVQVLEG